MSRKSADSNVVPIGHIARVSPPETFSVEQTETWNRIVNAKPADWFGEDNAGLLAEYVRALCMCETLEMHIQMALAGEQKEDGPSLANVLRLRDMEAKRATSIGTKLRLTQQSRYTPKAAATAANAAGATKASWLFGKQ